MSEFNFEDWFEEFWMTYPDDLSHGKKGTKLKAKAAAEKVHKMGGDLTEILRKTRSLMKYDRKARESNNKDDRPDRWPHASTYLNQGYYDREIYSHAELNIKIESQKCQCGAIAKYADRCLICFDKEYYPDHSRYLYEKGLIPYGLGKRKDETKEEWYRRCKEAFGKGVLGKLQTSR